MYKYTSVTIPVEMAQVIDQVIKTKCYRSRAEYVKHLIRVDIGSRLL